MKLLKSLKLKRNNPPRFRSGNTAPLESKSSFPSQTSGSQMFLRNINTKKRGIRNTKVVFRKHHGLAKKIIIFIFVIGIISYLVYRFEVLDYFKISTMQVEGASKFVNEEDVRVLVERNSFGQSTFFFDSNNLADILRKNFLGAKRIEVVKKYPNKVKVLVEERIPLAVVYNDDDEYFLIDSEGYVLGVVDDSFSDLPKINYEGHIIVGTFLEKDMIPISIEILKFAEKEDIKISSMSFSPKYTKIFVGRSTEVFIGYDKDRENSLSTMNALLKKLELEGKTVKKIDLRYDKVIVLYD